MTHPPHVVLYPERARQLLVGHAEDVDVIDIVEAPAGRRMTHPFPEVSARAAAALIGSTVLTVATAGPLLALEAGHAAVRPGHIIASLALIVALPLAAGIALRARTTLSPCAERAATTTTAVAAVAALIALTAAEVHLSAGYLPVALALIMFVAGSAVTGWLLGARARRPAAVAVLLTTSMRDFAIAAGLAAAAFGPAAAAPLGLYGILVLVWGTAAAGIVRAGRANGSGPARRRAPGGRGRDQLAVRDDP